MNEETVSAGSVAGDEVNEKTVSAGSVVADKKVVQANEGAVELVKPVVPAADSGKPADDNKPKLVVIDDDDCDDDVAVNKKYAVDLIVDKWSPEKFRSLTVGKTVYVEREVKKAKKAKKANKTRDKKARLIEVTTNRPTGVWLTVDDVHALIPLDYKPTSCNSPAYRGILRQFGLQPLVVHKKGRKVKFYWADSVYKLADMPDRFKVGKHRDKEVEAAKLAKLKFTSAVTEAEPIDVTTKRDDASRLDRMEVMLGQVVEALKAARLQ
jgi:hypothetical protein